MNEQPSKIYLLPNLMTAGNLFCGFTATLRILEGALLQSANADLGLHAWADTRVHSVASSIPSQTLFHLGLPLR